MISVLILRKEDKQPYMMQPSEHEEVEEAQEDMQEKGTNVAGNRVAWDAN